jgi:hypothetical protein
VQRFELATHLAKVLHVDLFNTELVPNSYVSVFYHIFGLFIGFFIDSTSLYCNLLGYNQVFTYFTLILMLHFFSIVEVVIIV